MEKILDFKIVNNVIVYNFINVKRFNITIADHVRNELLAKIKTPKTNIVLDLQGVEFIDSSGFGALVYVFNKAKNTNSIFKLCNISKEAMELVAITKLDKVFDICPSVDDCINSFN